MSTLERSIRLKRFDLNPSLENVNLMIETSLGEKYSLKILNVSMYGIAVEGEPQQTINLSSDEIISNSKIVMGDQEYAMGRAVIKFMRTDEEGVTRIGFATVDNKVPLEGALSKYLIRDNSEDSAFTFEISSDKFTLASFIETSHTNTDLFSRCRQFHLFVKNWERNPKFNYNCVRKPSTGIRVKLEDTYLNNKRSDYIMMGSNDYLGLCYHPKVVEETKKALDKYGVGSTGSHLLTGTCEVHEELAEELARLYRKDQAILFSSGYTANLGAIQALTTDNDFILADVLSHASLQDGMRMSPATSRFFKHNNMKHLESILSEKRQDYFGSLIVTEGVFSMDGDLAPLRELVQIAQKYNCRTLVDEAHGIGVIGDHGLGVSEKDGVIKNVDIIMGNMSKTLGSLGGFLCGDKEVMEWFRYFSRSRMFSTSMPPSIAQASLTSLKILKDNTDLIHKLRNNIKQFILGMRELGAPLHEHHESAIIPVVIGDEEIIGKINMTLKEAGIFVPPIVYPAVSRKSARFRFTISALHSISDIDYVVQTFARAMEKANFKFDEET